MNTFGSIRIVCVEPGTVIKDESTGEEVTVDEEHVVRKGLVFYVTQTQYDAIKARTVAP